MSLKFETVAIPVSKGIDLNTAARLVEAPTLLEAVNVTFNGDGASKRSGHVATKLRAGSYPQNYPVPVLSTPQLTPYGNKILDANWLLGWGFITSETRADTAADAANADLGPHPDAGYLFGGLHRDNEVVGWTGHSLITLAEGGESLIQAGATDTPGRIDPAVIPTLHAEPIAKSNKQYFADAAENDKIRVVVWSTGSSFASTGHQLLFNVYDKARGALVWRQQTITATKPWYPRIISMGRFFHIFWVELDTFVLHHTQFNDSDLFNSLASSTIDSCHGYYDVWKESEEKAVVLVNTSTNLNVYWYSANGNTPSDEVDSTLSILRTEDAVTQNIVPMECAICTHPTTGRIAIAVMAKLSGHGAGHLWGGVYSRAGVSTTAEVIDLGLVLGGAPEGFNRVTIAPKYILTSNHLDSFDSFVSTNGTGNDIAVYKQRFNQGGTIGSRLLRMAIQIASRAFRVGDRVFFWGSYNSTLQSQWFLMDESLYPVGKLNFNTAYTTPANSSDLGTMRSVNFYQTGTIKDQLVFHLALQYRLRVPTTDDQDGVYTEPGIQFVQLDFLPSLQTVQAGRCTYIAGAQLWCYDGETLTEAGFHYAPEATAAQVNGGSLTALGTYIYRIDVCHRNAQNEEVRSHSLIMDPVVLTGTNKTIVLTMLPVLTRRPDAYILIFRNAMVSGSPTSTWNLLNSRDPGDPSFLLNDQTAVSITYTDSGSVSDTAILSRELHPGNNNTFLQPFAAPACEVISAGRDRVWLAGGEIPAGQVYPSRLYQAGEVPAWNGNLAIQVDRNEDPITGIGFVGDMAAVFHRNSTYIQEGDGPDNNSNGFWPPARIAAGDCGALSQATICLCTGGLVFQSPTGFRLMNQGGQITPLGEPVDPLAQTLTITGALSVPSTNEIRWYHSDGAVVYNYLVGAWSTWTCGTITPLLTSDGEVFLCRTDGYVWKETDGHWRDGPNLYTMRVRFPWLHAGNIQDFQRIRRVSGFGTYSEPHSIRLRLYYDEEAHPREIFTWDFPDATQNTDTWGALTWGAGFWGDTAGTPRARDSIWRWRRRPRRQKCSVFSLSLDDHNTDGPGFALVGIALELAKKEGLDRIQPATNNSTFRP